MFSLQNVILVMLKLIIFIENANDLLSLCFFKVFFFFFFFFFFGERYFRFYVSCYMILDFFVSLFFFFSLSVNAQRKTYYHHSCVNCFFCSFFLAFILPFELLCVRGLQHLRLNVIRSTLLPQPTFSRFSPTWK